MSSMLTLPLQSSFLRSEFSDVRLVLRGRRRLKVKLVLSHEAVSAKAVPKNRELSVLRRTINYAILTILIMAITSLAILITPDLYYRFFPSEARPVVSTERGTPLGGEFAQGSQTATTQISLPAQDATLPTGTWLTIPKIGIRTQPQATQNPDEALATGVWLVPEYGRPGDTTQPIIMAAHRFGWQWWWQTDYWQYHSFYKLPELAPGDVVEVIHDQRKFYYEIYAGEEGEEISDYNADLILYTCKFLNSPLRHFRYARLIDPTKNTQAGTTEQANFDI